MSDRGNNWLRLFFLFALILPAILLPILFHMGTWLPKFFGAAGTVQVAAGGLLGYRNHKSSKAPQVSNSSLLGRLWVKIMHSDAWCAGAIGVIGAILVVGSIFATQ